MDKKDQIGQKRTKMNKIGLKRKMVKKWTKLPIFPNGEFLDKRWMFETVQVR